MKLIISFAVILSIAALLGSESPTTDITPQETINYYKVKFPLSVYPPEMVENKITKPMFREVEPFEKLDGWKVESKLSVSLKKTKATKVFGDSAAEIAINSKGNGLVKIIPLQPIPLQENENGICFWYRLPQYRYIGGPVFAFFVKICDGEGKTHSLKLYVNNLTFRAWAPAFLRVDLNAIRPWSLVGIDCEFKSRDQGNPPYFILMDSIQLFHDDIDFPGKKPQLPEPKPTVATTMQPRLLDQPTVSASQRGQSFYFDSKDGKDQIRCIIKPQKGDFSDISVSVNGEKFQPCLDGGPTFEMEGEFLRPGENFINVALKNANFDGKTLHADFQARSNVGGDGYTDEFVDYTISYTLRGKTLVVDFKSKQGKISELNFGKTSLPNTRFLQIPYLILDKNGPRIVDCGKFYFSGIADLWNSDATKLFGRDGSCNGGVQYDKLSDGTRNPVRERFMLNFSSEFSEVLPTLPNPISPYIKKYANACWRWGMTEWDWPRQLYAQGVRYFQYRSHADLHRDINESYGFRAAAAPSKSEAFIKHLRDDMVKRDFGYAPYNCYTESNWFIPEFSINNLRRTSTGQFTNFQQTPAAAQQVQEKYANMYVNLYQPTFSYLDVHGAREPWRHPDMRAKSYMAGMFRCEFLGNAALMRRNSEIFNGPCFTEGNMHWFYAGFFDMVYGYMGHAVTDSSKIDDIVDFSLLSIKPHAIQLGMGDYFMYYKNRRNDNDPTQFQRFISATLIYGHAAFLEIDLPRNYFLTNAVQRRYIGTDVNFIGYSDGKKIMPTSEAMHTEARSKGFIHVAYTNGLKIYSNLNKNGESWNIAGKTIPATGFYAKMDDGSVEAFLLEHDYVSSPEYIYLGTTDKPVQENGITLKSGRVAIAYENATSFRVYPTVNLKDLTFNPKTLKLPVAPEYRVEISDLDGKLLDKKTFKMEDGKITLDHTVNKATCYIFFTEKVK